MLSSYLNDRGICGLSWYGDNSLYGLLVNYPATLLLSSCIAVMFIESGYLLYKTLPQFFEKSNLNAKNGLILCALCIGSLVLDYGLLKYYAGDLHKLNIGNVMAYMICSYSGLIFVCTLSKIVEKYSRYIRSLLMYFGIGSLIIMTTHTEYYVNSIANLVVTKALYLSGIIEDARIISGLSLALIMFIEVGVVYLVNHTYLRYLYTVPQRISLK